MEPRTESLARRALADRAPAAVSGERLWAVMAPALTDPSTTPAILARWHDLGIDRELLGGFAATDERAGLVGDALALLGRLLALGGTLSEAGSAGSDPVERATEDAVAASMLCLSYDAPAVSVEAWIDRFAPVRSLRRVLVGGGVRIEAVRAALAAGACRPSGDHRVLGPLGLAELAVVGALSGASEVGRIEREVARVRPLALRITAADLLAVGAAPGPALGRALETTLDARRDGAIGPEEELAYALGRLADSERPGR
jgi:hypothetical protein